jgi:hypothetical protein
VKVTISAWNGLLDAIELRLLSQSTKTNDQDCFYLAELIQHYDLHKHFLEKFLQQARFPVRFEYVAPGLRLKPPT